MFNINALWIEIEIKKENTIDFKMKKKIGK